MPMLAHFENLSPAADRRRTMRRALKLGIGGAGEPVTVHDLSLSGALLETSIPMLVGAVFEVELPQAGKIEASIVWNSGEFYGCQFSLPISPAALSAAQLQSAVEVPVTLETAGESLAVRLQRLRRARGLTLAQIAERLGVSKPTVWAWEQGKARPVAARMDALAEALGVEAEDLAAGDSDGGKLGQAIAKARRELSAAAGVGPERIRIFLEM